MTIVHRWNYVQLLNQSNYLLIRPRINKFQSVSHKVHFSSNVSGCCGVKLYDEYYTMDYDPTLKIVKRK